MIRLPLLAASGLALAAAALALAARAAAPGAALPARAEPAAFGLEHWTLDAAAQRGRAVYERFCIGCHGESGRGDGPAAEWLDPRPRNFQSGRFKFRSTPSGELPTIDDIVHVVRCGLNGSAMRSFPLLPETALRDVAAYVRSLAEFGLVRDEVAYLMEDEGLTLEEVLADELDAVLDEVRELAYEDVWPVAVPPRGEMDAASIARGKALYEAQCVACHGAGGTGDGSSSFHLRDWKDASIRPRDFTTGIFRAGSTPRDVFLRLRTGLNGTPMPAVAGDDAALWDIAHYILSLVDDERRAAPHPTSCDAHAGGAGGTGSLP